FHNGLTFYFSQWLLWWGETPGEPSRYRFLNVAAREYARPTRCCLKAATTLFFGVCNIDAHFRAVGANLGDIHRLSKNRQRVELAGHFSAEIVTNFPDALGQLVDEHGHF